MRKRVQLHADCVRADGFEDFNTGPLPAVRRYRRGGDVDLFIPRNGDQDQLWLNDGLGGFTQVGAFKNATSIDTRRLIYEVAPMGLSTNMAVLADMDRDGAIPSAARGARAQNQAPGAAVNPPGPWRRGGCTAPHSLGALGFCFSDTETP